MILYKEVQLVQVLYHFVNMHHIKEFEIENFKIEDFGIEDFEIEDFEIEDFKIKDFKTKDFETKTSRLKSKIINQLYTLDDKSLSVAFIYPHLNNSQIIEATQSFGIYLSKYYRANP